MVLVLVYCVREDSVDLVLRECCRVLALCPCCLGQRSVVGLGVMKLLPFDKNLFYLACISDVRPCGLGLWLL